jgi:hypothetical protein
LNRSGRVELTALTTKRPGYPLHDSTFEKSSY